MASLSPEMNRCIDLCYQAFQVLDKIGLPNPMKIESVPEYNKSKIYLMETFFSNSTYDLYVSEIVHNWCKKINDYLELDTNMDKIYHDSIFIDDETKAVDFQDILFCRIGTYISDPNLDPDKIEDSSGHENFAIFDKTNSEVHIYDPNGQNFLKKFSHKNRKKYMDFISKMLNCDYPEKMNIEDVKLENRFSSLHTFNRISYGLQALADIPFCVLFSIYMNILVFAVYQICDEQEKKNIGELTSCIEQMLISSIQSQNISSMDFMYHIGSILSKTYLGLIPTHFAAFDMKRDNEIEIIIKEYKGNIQAYKQVRDLKKKAKLERDRLERLNKQYSQERLKLSRKHQKIMGKLNGDNSSFDQYENIVWHDPETTQPIQLDSG